LKMNAVDKCYIAHTLDASTEPYRRPTDKVLPTALCVGRT